MNSVNNAPGTSDLATNKFMLIWLRAVDYHSAMGSSESREILRDLFKNIPICNHVPPEIRNFIKRVETLDPSEIKYDPNLHKAAHAVLNAALKIQKSW